MVASKQNAKIWYEVKHSQVDSAQLLASHVEAGLRRCCVSEAAFDTCKQAGLPAFVAAPFVRGIMGTQLAMEKKDRFKEQWRRH